MNLCVRPHIGRFTGRHAVAVKIYCPGCAWAPGRHDEWECRPGCGTVWNTFETRGRCPGCQKRWLVTVCLACFVSSLHEAWYHEEDEDCAAWDAFASSFCAPPRK